MKRIGIAVGFAAVMIVTFAACERSVGYNDNWNNNNGNQNQNNNNNTNDCTGESLCVEVDENTPTSEDIPQNARNVHYARYKVTAPSTEGATIMSPTLTREGLGMPDDFQNVYLVIDEVHQTYYAGVSTSTNQVEFVDTQHFIPAGQFIYIDVYANMDAYANSENFFCIDVAEHLHSVGEITGNQINVVGVPDFPLCGEPMTTTSAMVGTLIYRTEISENGLNDENVSSTDIILEAEGEDMDLEVMVLEQVGSLDGTEWSFGSLYVEDGTLIEIPVSIERDGDYVRISLTETYYLERGTPTTFRMVNQLHSPVPCETVGFKIHEPYHVEAIGRVYGYGVQAVEHVESGDSDVRFIPGAQLGFAFASTNPVGAYIPAGSNDVPMMTFVALPQADMTMRTYEVQLFMQLDPSWIVDLKVQRHVGPGMQLAGGPVDVGGGWCYPEANPTVYMCYVEFTDDVILDMCVETLFTITLDVTSNAQDGILVARFPASQVEAEYSDGLSVEQWDLEGGILHGNDFFVQAN